MASNAWTATRADLVKELANAKARERAATERAATVAAENVHLAGQALLAEANRQDAVTTLALIREALQRKRLNVPPDPNAAQHRRTLIAALKEKP